MRASLSFAVVLLYLVACGSTSTQASNDVLAAGSCRASADCDEAQSEYCARPGEGPGCGVCYEGDCFSDAECEAALGAGHICAPLTGPCTCGHGGECAQGCALVGCGPEADCGADGRCVPRVCAVDHDCGDAQVKCAAGVCKVPACLADADCGSPNVLCDTSSLSCHRISCSSDAECSGYCVLGLCYEEPGQCLQPVA